MCALIENAGRLVLVFPKVVYITGRDNFDSPLLLCPMTPQAPLSVSDQVTGYRFFDLTACLLHIFSLFKICRQRMDFMGNS